MTIKRPIRIVRYLLIASWFAMNTGVGRGNGKIDREWSYSTVE
jgi:hypothetical protein